MRLGSIAYVNTLPVDMALCAGHIPTHAMIHRDVPSKLNQKLIEGKLDLSPVSVWRYGMSFEDLLLIPNFSVSSKSGVQSVLLFSEKPIEALAGTTVRVTDQGNTTPVLLDILLKKKYGVTARYERKSLSTDDLSAVNAATSLLLIGDDALKAQDQLKQAGRKLHVYDLAAEWTQWTGLSFVFAVWVTRRSYYEKYPYEVEMMRAQLEASRRWGKSHPDALIREAQTQTGLSEKTLTEYYKNLQFGLDKELIAGLERFFELGTELGHFSKRPLIRMIGGEAGAAARKAKEAVL